MIRDNFKSKHSGILVLIARLNLLHFLWIRKVFTPVENAKNTDC